MMKLYMTYMLALFAMLSAFCWLKSARAIVLADKSTGGVGALLGGDVIIKGENGERIDLHETLLLQSRWSRYGAYSAAACALAQAALLFTTPI